MHAWQKEELLVEVEELYERAKELDAPEEVVDALEALVESVADISAYDDADEEED